MRVERDAARVAAAEARAAVARQEGRRVIVNDECRRRIVAVVDEAAQLNLAGAAAGDLLTASQVIVYKAGLAWITAMRGVAEAMKEPGDNRDPSDDAHWPAPSAEVVALAGAF
ncbi:hypothetical protein [Pseudoroseicyclus aestuarii]|uniref:Uncharacterized protein n=1 Tax=Pseudoroseicyclus aestuarii TaxID=1795041 RepID=A0A318SM74_9RHOB|nr:hypothetical protein [Pseudoroseicyclus aestuarii]PYE80806.1 hypothetical protein DFP88_11116 [Pseudoroseicyclus aestuarii]